MECEDVVPIPKSILEEHPHCFAMRVEGDCMAPTIHEGSIVVVDPCATELSGELTAVVFNGSRHLCRVLRTMGQLLMVHDNPKYSSLKVPKLVIMGNVIWTSETNDTKVKTPTFVAQF